MELRNYSEATISVYRCALKQFLEWREADGFFTIRQGRSASLFVEPLPQRQEVADGERGLFGDAQVLRARPRARMGCGTFAPAAQRAEPARHIVHPGSRAFDQLWADLQSTRFYGAVVWHSIRLSRRLNLRIVDIDYQRQQLRIVKGRCQRALCVHTGVPVGSIAQLLPGIPVEGYLFNGRSTGEPLGEPLRATFFGAGATGGGHRAERVAAYPAALLCNSPPWRMALIWYI